MTSALVELAGLHDDGEMLTLILEQRKVPQRIAVDDQQIGKGARRQRADLPSSRRICAGMVVAERMISMGAATSRRNENSRLWSQCSSPKRSLP